MAWPVVASPFFGQKFGSSSRAFRDASVLFDGHFVGNYSLAIVNRALASGLIRTGLDLQMECLDPVSDLGEAIEDQTLARHFTDVGSASPDIHIRNHWPPDVTTMRGQRNVLAGFAWEETALPDGLVSEFNAHLSLITTPSQFVADALHLSGVSVPIHVTGIGCDQQPLVRKTKAVAERSYFLHVSTGLERKGVDVLLRAYFETFRAGDGIDLVIKTNENPNNRVEDLLTDLRGAFPDAPPVRVIKRSLSDTAMAMLYANALGVVQPSRGEGFCMPLAEALRHGTPVITTGFGGQVDFCDDTTADLVDYRLRGSTSHVGHSAGLWAEPCASDLGGAMFRVAAAPKAAARRARKGRALVRRRYRWDDVARQTLRAMASVVDKPKVEPTVSAVPDIDLVSTWQQRCGIATYSEALFGTPVLGPRLNRVLGRVIKDDELSDTEGMSAIHRPWGYDTRGIERLALILSKPQSPILWIQHHSGFFSTGDMRRLGSAMNGYRQKVITLHNAETAIRDGHDWLEPFDRIFVHNPEDVATLVARGLIQTVHLPHGVPPLHSNDPARAKSGAVTRLSTFGFLQPHKNVGALIAAFAIVRMAVPNASIRLLNALRPNVDSQREAERLTYLIDRLDLRDSVSLETEYRPEHDVVQAMADSDLVIFPYGQSGEGATGAVRLALAADRPLLISDDTCLHDLAPYAHVLRATSPRRIADAVLTLLGHADLRHRHDHARRQFAGQMSFPRVAERASAILSCRASFG